MSGIYIPNMEMPTDGVTIIEIHSNGATFRYSKSFGGWEKTEDAIPVPDHWRLIEDEPIQMFITAGLNSGEFGYDQIKVLTEIQYAPTILPADVADNGV